MFPQNWCEPKSTSKLLNRRTEISAGLVLCRQLLKPVRVVSSDGLLQRQSWSHTNLHLHAYHGPFHFISTPPYGRGQSTFTPPESKKKNPGPPPPLRNCLNSKFSFPLRKKPIFFQTPSEIFKRSKAPTQRPPQKWRSRAPQKIFSIGVVWILNGMAPYNVHLYLSQSSSS